MKQERGAYHEDRAYAGFDHYTIVDAAGELAGDFNLRKGLAINAEGVNELEELIEKVLARCPVKIALKIG